MSADTITTDAFHRGAFHLLQPAKGAHRAGLDAMLLAACVGDAPALRVADFGAGTGAAGMAVAARCKGAQVTLIERDTAMADLARRTKDLPENAALADRLAVVETDIDRIGQGDCAVPRDHFDWVIMNPPFNDARDRMSPHDARAGAHVLDVDLFERWIRKAATVCHAKGRLALIARPQSLADIVAACDRRFGGLRVKPIHARNGNDAIRVLVTGQKGNRARLAITAPLVLHAGTDGHSFTDEADALINGRASLV